MPRSTKSRGVNDDATGGVTTLEPEENTEQMTSATDTDIDEDLDGPENFTFTSEPAPEDFTPDRKTPGRVRKPSVFDDILRKDNVFDTGGWQRIPVDSEEHADAALRELNRSKLHLNKLGLAEGLPEIGLDLDVRLKAKGYDEDAVYYRSRTAQKRERKNGTNGSEADSVDETETDDTQEYTDE